MNKKVVEQQTQQIIEHFHKLPCEMSVFEFADYLKEFGV